MIASGEFGERETVSRWQRLKLLLVASNGKEFGG